MNSSLQEAAHSHELFRPTAALQRSAHKDCDTHAGKPQACNMRHHLGVATTCSKVPVMSAVEATVQPKPHITAGEAHSNLHTQVLASIHLALHAPRSMVEVCWLWCTCGLLLAAQQCRCNLVQPVSQVCHVCCSGGVHARKRAQQLAPSRDDLRVALLVEHARQ
jgi:hypothetical protein